MDRKLAARGFCTARLPSFSPGTVWGATTSGRLGMVRADDRARRTAPASEEQRRIDKDPWPSRFGHVMEHVYVKPILRN